MSRATIRQHVVDFLNPAGPLAVPGLHEMRLTRPRDMSTLSYTGNQPGVLSGAIGSVFIEAQTEQPIALNGSSGIRLTEYTVLVEVFHSSAEDNADDAMASFDEVVDGLCARLRSSATFGLTETQALNERLLSMAYERLEVEYGVPEQVGSGTGGFIVTWAGIRFPVQEQN